jgi:hypothetical protein
MVGQKFVEALLLCKPLRRRFVDVPDEERLHDLHDQSLAVMQ